VLVAKRLELLHEIAPAMTSVAFLVNPANSVFAEAETKEFLAAARTLGVRPLILNASVESEIDAAFSTLLRERAGGLVPSGEAFLFAHTQELIALAARHQVPAIFSDFTYAAAGGLMSYGTDLLVGFRQIGAYVGRILRGEKPADLPVEQLTKVRLVINMKTAKALGLTIPETLLATADEVIQ
jgi:putative ABC transport system substrate-binding protein